MLHTVLYSNSSIRFGLVWLSAAWFQKKWIVRSKRKSIGMSIERNIRNLKKKNPIHKRHTFYYSNALAVEANILLYQPGERFSETELLLRGLSLLPNLTQKRNTYTHTHSMNIIPSSSSSRILFMLYRLRSHTYSFHLPRFFHVFLFPRFSLFNCSFSLAVYLSLSFVLRLSMGREEEGERETEVTP